MEKIFVSKHVFFKKASKVTLYILVLMILIPSIFVFFWMFTSSLKKPVDIYAMPPRWFTDFSFDGYLLAIRKTPFLSYLINSTIVAFSSTIIGLIIGLPAAFSIARYKQRKIGLAILAARLMPGIAYLVPLFILFLQLRMIGSHITLILSHLVITFPVTVWIMVGFFEDFPNEILDAALVDGCTRIGALIRVILPLTKPAITTSGILAFISSWNDFKMALVLANKSTRTLPIAAFQFVHEAAIDWGPMMAYATLITIPVLILMLFIQSNIVRGLTLGGLK